MTYSIIKEPHPLDDIWNLAMLAVENADEAIEALGNDFEDAQLDALVAVRWRAVMSICALPARNLGDTIYKCTVSGIWNGNPLSDVSATAIFNEADELLDAAIARGHALKESEAAA